MELKGKKEYIKINRTNGTWIVSHLYWEFLNNSVCIF